MDEKAATNVAEALGASAWQSGGDIWLVLRRPPKTFASLPFLHPLRPSA